MKKIGMMFVMVTLSFSISSQAQLKVLSGGRVGIGTNDVSGYKCHIDGDPYLTPLYITTTTGNWGYGIKVTAQVGLVKCIAGGQGPGDNFFALTNGVIFNQNHYLYSDSRLKESVATIDNPMAKIMGLRGVYYNYKPIESMDADLGVSFSNEARQMGLIAQEVQSVAPEVVNETDRGLLGVSYSNLVALLIEGMKAQQVQLSEMEARLAGCCGGSPAARGTRGDASGTKDAAVHNIGNDADGNSIALAKQGLNAKLYQNTPNPFNTVTTVRYETPPGISDASIIIFDMQGKFLKSYRNLSAGKGTITINASELKAGMYLYSLLIDGQEIDTKKMILME